MTRVQRGRLCRQPAKVAELVDALDLGSSAARLGGSSPFLRTKEQGFGNANEHRSVKQAGTEAQHGGSGRADRSRSRATAAQALAHRAHGRFSPRQGSAQDRCAALRAAGALGSDRRRGAKGVFGSRPGAEIESGRLSAHRTQGGKRREKADFQRYFQVLPEGKVRRLGAGKISPTN